MFNRPGERQRQRRSDQVEKHLCTCMYIVHVHWVCCVTLPCCLFDLALFFLPSFSHLSLKHVYIHVNMYTYIHCKYVLSCSLTPFQSIILQTIAYMHSQEPLTSVKSEPRPPLTGQELHPPLSPVVREHLLGHLCTRTAETAQEGGGQGREEARGGREEGCQGRREGERDMSCKAEKGNL